MKKETKRKSLVALGALALILAVGATAGTTLAKYTSSKTVPSATATVAKWGFVINVNATEIFGKNYEAPATEDGLSVVSTKADGDNAVVVSASSKDGKVVAPGTTGKFVIGISGTAEVDADVTFAVTGTETVEDIYLNTKGAGNDASAYRPIKWTVKTNKDTTGTPYYTVNDLTTAISNLKFRYEANTEYENYLNEITVTWEWAFSVNDATDKKDTTLGRLSYLKSLDSTKTSQAEKDELAEYDFNTKLTIPTITVKVEQTNKAKA